MHRTEMGAAEGSAARKTNDKKTAVIVESMTHTFKPARGAKIGQNDKFEEKMKQQKRDEMRKKAEDVKRRLVEEERKEKKEKDRLKQERREKMIREKRKVWEEQFSKKSQDGKKTAQDKTTKHGKVSSSADRKRTHSISEDEADEDVVSVKPKPNLEIPNKPKIKKFNRPMPPHVTFADILKMAEQMQHEPVDVFKKPIQKKKKPEQRPMSQFEKDRLERINSKEYKHWVKHGIGNPPSAVKRRSSDEDSSDDERKMAKKDSASLSASNSRLSINSVRDRSPAISKPEHKLGIPKKEHSSMISQKRPVPGHEKTGLSKQSEKTSHSSDRHKGGFTVPKISDSSGQKKVSHSSSSNQVSKSSSNSDSVSKKVASHSKENHLSVHGNSAGHGHSSVNSAKSSSDHRHSGTNHVTSTSKHGQSASNHAKTLSSHSQSSSSSVKPSGHPKMQSQKFSNTKHEVSSDKKSSSKSCLNAVHKYSENKMATKSFSVSNQHKVSSSRVVENNHGKPVVKTAERNHNHKQADVGNLASRDKHSQSSHNVRMSEKEVNRLKGKGQEFKNSETNNKVHRDKGNVHDSKHKSLSSGDRRDLERSKGKGNSSHRNNYNLMHEKVLICGPSSPEEEMPKKAAAPPASNPCDRIYGEIKKKTPKPGHADKTSEGDVVNAFKAGSGGSANLNVSDSLDLDSEDLDFLNDSSDVVLPENENDTESSTVCTVGGDTHSEFSTVYTVGGDRHSESSTVYKVGGNTHSESSAGYTVGGDTHSESSTVYKDGGDTHSESSTVYKGGVTHSESSNVYSFGSTGNIHLDSLDKTGLNSTVQANSTLLTFSPLTVKYDTDLGFQTEKETDVAEQVTQVLSIFPDADRTWVTNCLRIEKLSHPDSFVDCVCEILIDSRHKNREINGKKKNGKKRLPSKNSPKKKVHSVIEKVKNSQKYVDLLSEQAEEAKRRIRLFGDSSGSPENTGAKQARLETDMQVDSPFTPERQPPNEMTSDVSTTPPGKPDCIETFDGSYQLPH
ncbi:filaggrin-2-like isoform X3 [Gigantopelta aegis]|uniref:filaggrin-2-like isoform X3 n=1 Tax=Gigantopelta aegis TaxID=1735272 RepID=UPI001B88DF33|nr:filaggrin-2-like isoform X3 [Gigantopelta aegis]